MEDRESPEFRHVYFIEAVGLGVIKIGSANDVRKRIGTLQTGCPAPLVLLGVFHVDDAHKFEKELHHSFAKQRRHGEWFEADDELRQMIDAISAPDDDSIRIVVRPRDPEPAVFEFTARPGERRRDMWDRFYREADAAGVDPELLPG